MQVSTATLATVCFFTSIVAVAQTGEERETAPQPLYRVTIVSRTTKAINYGYLTEPTRIGFRGTPLLGDARGEATIQAKRGSTTIDAKFSKVPPPTRFGPQFLTYVAWAISTDGRPQNLGEISLSGSDKGKLSASTSLQAFALIVTAEPYYSVSQPSDVVVMENEVRPETVGKVVEMNATYELLPRKEFTYDMSRPAAASGKPVSRHEYESILAIYEAQNAIQIADSQNADGYAPERLAQARQMLARAKSFPKNQSSEIIATAKEAAQVAEDARLIAQKRAEEKRLAEKRSHTSEVRNQPEVNQAEVTRTEIEAGLEQEERARTELATVTARQTQQPVQAQASAPPAVASERAIDVDEGQFRATTPQASENRRRLLSALHGPLDVRDTGRGIVVTIPNNKLSSPELRTQLAQVASAIGGYKDLRIEVEGYSAIPDSGSSQRNAELIRAKLIGASVPAPIVLARGYGNSRPLASNSSSAGRAQNDRVEVVIKGDAIGSVATWDHLYSIAPTTARR
jgi:flagellar motor protein MotB